MLAIHLFLSEQTKKLRQVYKSDPTAATSMAFDLISDMENQPDRYSRLLNAVKDAGNINQSTGLLNVISAGKGLSPKKLSKAKSQCNKLC